MILKIIITITMMIMIIIILITITMNNDITIKLIIKTLKLFVITSIVTETNKLA